MASLFDPPADNRTASQRIRAARLAQLVNYYERSGWPLEVVRLLDAHPLVPLSEILDGYTVPKEA